MKVDNAIVKIDSAREETIRLIDRPQFNYSLEKIIEGLAPFKGRFVLQTMFLKGKFDGVVVNNTTSEEVELWYRVVRTRPTA